MEKKDYKKLYEDVVALAKDGLKDGLYLSRSAKEVTEFLFPQLKETEDEKVRRELTTFLIDFNNGYYSRPSEDKIDSWIKWLDKEASDIITEKTNNNFNPKFKIGDWIVYEGLGTYQVVEINEGWYSVIDSNDRRWSVMFESESLCHIWSINDAKDGDILTVVNDERPFIFRGLLDKLHPKNPVAYCGIAKRYGFIISKSNDWWTDEKVEPATKELSDSLFQKIHEEGYEWDAEKKELGKIEKQCEQIHAEWSEEDESMLTSCIGILGKCRMKELPNKVEEELTWLISFKDRIQPRLKQENTQTAMDAWKNMRLEVFSQASGNRNVSDESTKMFSLTDIDEIFEKISETIVPNKNNWTEEDEKMKNLIIRTLTSMGTLNLERYYKMKLDEVNEWFNSTKNKITLQPNQYDKGYKDGYSAAKYNQWRPTNKQMEDFRMLLDYNTGVFDSTKLVSADSLYDDLKKNLID